MVKMPLLVVPAISKDGGIAFVSPEKTIELDETTAQSAWPILEFCDGTNSIDTIVEALPDMDAQFIRGFLNDLNSLGIVIDSREFYKHFHAISSNPTVYPSGITSDEIVQHTRSPRMPVKEGQPFAFRHATASALVGLQERRSSCRSFTDEVLSIDEVGGVLDIGYSLRRHAVPSAGGLYPMKIFAVVLKDQKDFPAGYYEYDNENDQLVLFNRTPDPQRIFYAFNDIEMPFGAPVVFVIAADADRQPHKYSNRGYRFMAIEAGQIAQNISLGAVEAGLATCELGVLLDDAIADELDLTDCLPFLAVAIGKRSTSEEETVWQIADRFERTFVGDDKPVQDMWLADDMFADNCNKPYFQFLARTANGQITSGISTCWADAKLKAIAEGYERQRSDSVRCDIRSTARLLSEPWLDPRVVAPLTDEQYGNLSHLQKFDEDLEIEWVRGTDNAGETVFVPIDLVFYPIHDIDRKLVVNTCSSGFATFSDLEEAVNRGTLEIVERDSLMRSWYERKSPRKLSFDILPVHLQNRVRYWRERGREVFVLDLSQRGAIIIEVVITSGEYPCFVSGASSSLTNFEEVAIKALHEAESRLIYGLNNENTRAIKPNKVHGILDHELLYAQSTQYHEYVQFLFDGSVTHQVPVVSASFSELKEELAIVTVDVSEEGSPLSVVRVLSPELVPISFGYGADHYTHHSLCEAKGDQLPVPHYFA